MRILVIPPDDILDDSDEVSPTGGDDWGDALDELVPKLEIELLDIHKELIEELLELEEELTLDVEYLIILEELEETDEDDVEELDKDELLLKELISSISIILTLFSPDSCPINEYQDPVHTFSE